MRRDDCAGEKNPPKATTLKSRGGVSPLDVLDARFVAEARSAAHFAPQGPPEVAFAGRSNVGKSTLINAVCQRKGLARTSRTPGCTRGVVMFDLRFRSGAALRLVDLPGYGYAGVSKSERRAWGPLIENYLSKRETLRGVLILVDSRRGPESEEDELMEYLRSIGVPYVLVATKADKMSRSERGLAFKIIGQRSRARVIGTSGETGEGRDEVVKAMLALAFPPTEREGSQDRALSQKQHSTSSTPAQG